MGIIIVLMKRVTVLKQEWKNLYNNKKRGITLLVVSILISIIWLALVVFTLGDKK